MLHLLETYYVTWGGHATDAAPGAPMPAHGKSLGKIAAPDFKSIVEKGLLQYGESATIEKLKFFTSFLLSHHISLQFSCFL